jgi:hypothetical protein
VLVVHGTKKLRDRLKAIPLHGSESSTTALGDWYATAVFWRPHVCLFVNEASLLPVLLPLAPSATLAARFPDALSDVLAAHGAADSFRAAERAEMVDVRLATTTNRSVVGTMNEFIFLAQTYTQGTVRPDLLELSLRLAQTPCGPLYSSHISPDRELATFLARPHHDE